MVFMTVSQISGSVSGTRLPCHVSYKPGKCVLNVQPWGLLQPTQIKSAPPSRQDFPLLAQVDSVPAPPSQPKADSAVTPPPTFTVANPLSPTMDELLHLTSNPDAMAAYRDSLQSLKSISP
jgi:hypothetical protein